MNKQRRKIKIDMSVEMDVLIDGDRPTNEYKDKLNTIAHNYIQCLGDKSIYIDDVRFI